MTIRVSCIITAYNYGAYITESIESALGQSFGTEGMEIIVVDDGSTDETPGIVDAFAARHPDVIRSVRQENAGYVAAMNRALSLARGEYIAILDADDVWPSDKIARQVEMLDGSPHVGLVYSDLEVIDRDGRIVRPSLFEWFTMWPFQGSSFGDFYANAHDPVVASSIMVRSSLRRLFWPVPQGVPYVDWWIGVRSAATADIACLSGIRTGYRLHGGNLTLGVSGPNAVREERKKLQMRRWLLRHGELALLTREQLERAVPVFDNAAVSVVNAANTCFVRFVEVTDEDREVAESHLELAAQCDEADPRAAVEHLVRAVAADPYNDVVRARIADLLPRVPVDDRAHRLVGAAIDGCHDVIVVALITELLGRPDLLTTYIDAVGSAQNITLLLVGDGTAEEITAISRLFEELDARGVPQPDVMVSSLPLDGRTAAILGRRVDLLLTGNETPALPNVPLDNGDGTALHQLMHRVDRSGGSCRGGARTVPPGQSHAASSAA